MRKDKKSQYQLKKEKLHCIKYILQIETKITYPTPEENIRQIEKIFNEIWELVKDE